MFKNILKGLRSYNGALRLINELKLWKFFLIPMLISLFMGVATLMSAYYLAESKATYFDSLWPWETGADLFHSITKWVSGLSIILLGLILYKHVVMALSAPFLSPLAEKIEKHLYPNARFHKSHRDTNNWSQLWRAIKINARNLTYEFAITIPLLLLSFIPIIGIIFTIMAFMVQAYYAGFGNMDYALERHFIYRDSVKFVKQRRGMAIGIGLVFIAVLFIPVVGVIIVLPISATAASQLTLEEIIKDVPASQVTSLSQ